MESSAAVITAKPVSQTGSYDQPVVHEDKAARFWLFMSIAFLCIGVVLGLITAIKFVLPEFLGKVAWLSLGRIRPTHNNLVVTGWLVSANVAAFLFITPRLCKTKLYSEKLALWAGYIWLVANILALFSVPLGYTQGKEWADWPWWVDLLIVVSWVLVSYVLFQTIANRRVKQMYTSLWYMMGTLIWTAAVYIIGNWPAGYTGVNDANINWFYGHMVVGLIATPAGLALAYYFIPKASRSPLWSHTLSMIGFWSIAFIYAWNGAHHLTYGPIPTWLTTVAAVFSVLLLIPVFTAVTNFYLTPIDLAKQIRTNPIVNLFIWGTTFYLATCIQGPAQALRSVSQYVHFTDWVVGHAHMALFGAFTAFAIGAAYYMLPIMYKRPIYSRGLQWVQIHLMIWGFVIFALDMWVGGFYQGWLWKHTSLSFIETVVAMQPFYWIRIIGGSMMVLSMFVFAYNAVMTALMAEPRKVALTEREAEALATGGGSVAEV